MNKLTRLLSKILKIDESQIEDGLTQNSTSTWDSMNHLLLVAEIEKEFQVRLTTSEVVNMDSVKSVKEVLKNHGVQIST